MRGTGFAREVTFNPLHLKHSCTCISTMEFVLQAVRQCVLERMTSKVVRGVNSVVFGRWAQERLLPEHRTLVDKRDSEGLVRA
jgi:hypothetical protein